MLPPIRCMIRCEVRERCSFDITALAKNTQTISTAEKVRLTVVPSRSSWAQTGKLAVAQN